MAIGANDSNVKVVGGGLYTGVTNVKVSMICPTSDEMKKVGMNPKNDPVYLTTGENNVSKFRVDFFLLQDEYKIYPKCAFFLEDKIRKNKDGTKVEWINKFGNTAWSANETTLPDYTWFKTEGARPALVGEANITKFIKAWANVDQTSQAALDNPSALAKGDLTELKALFATIPNNKIQVLLGVKDGKYQDVYTNYFDRPYRTVFDQWRKELEKDGQEYKSDYQGDLRPKPYQGNSGVSSDSPTNMDIPTGTEPGPAPTGKPAYNF